MDDRYTDQLSDYLDDELSPGDRALLDAHLDECEECRAVLAELRQVRAHAQALDEITPARDLWSGVAARIGVRRPAALPIAPRRRVSFTVPQLLAAGIAVMVASGAGALALRGGAPPIPEADDPGGAEVAAVAWSASVTTRYDAAVDDLVQVLATERERLSPETVRIIEDNLAIIDRAIERSRQALVEDPESDFLRAHLESTMRRKLDLLQRATSLTNAL